MNRLVSRDSWAESSTCFPSAHVPAAILPLRALHGKLPVQPLRPTLHNAKSGYTGCTALHPASAAVPAVSFLITRGAVKPLCVTGEAHDCCMQ